MPPPTCRSSAATSAFFLCSSASMASTALFAWARSLQPHRGPSDRGRGQEGSLQRRETTTKHLFAALHLLDPCHGSCGCCCCCCVWCVCVCVCVPMCLLEVLGQPVPRLRQLVRTRLQPATNRMAISTKTGRSSSSCSTRGGGGEGGSSSSALTFSSRPPRPCTPASHGTTTGRDRERTRKNLVRWYLSASLHP